MKTFKYVSRLLLVLLAFNTLTMAEDSAREIDSDVNGALSQFYHEVAGSKKFLENAKGYVVFPDINEAGFFFGGKYGEGALRVNGATKGYYSITSASVGLQMGLQNYALVIAFMSDKALKRFMTDDDWETEIDVNMAIAEWNAEEELDDIDFGTDMIGFLFDSKGMMGNFSFEGTSFEVIHPD
jgi:lipid-binding SYLF domain-containing protein